LIFIGAVPVTPRSEKNPNMPQKCDMSVHLLNYITMLKYNLPGVIRKVLEFLTVNNNLDLSINGINDALFCVGEVC
jgi:hypothetical protein